LIIQNVQRKEKPGKKSSRSQRYLIAINFTSKTVEMCNQCNYDSSPFFFCFFSIWSEYIILVKEISYLTDTFLRETFLSFNQEQLTKSDIMLMLTQNTKIQINKY